MKTFVVGAKKSGKNLLAVEKAKSVVKFLNNVEKKEKPIKINYLMSFAHLKVDEQIDKFNDISDMAGADVKKTLAKDGLLKAFSGNSVNDFHIFSSVAGFYAQELFKPRNNNFKPYENVIEELRMILQLSKNVIFISEFIFCDSNYEGVYDEKFYNGLSKINLFLAKECSQVIECSYGKEIRIK